MNKMLVAVFDTEAAAFEGLSALRDLHREGEITLYATTVLVRDNSGKITIKRVDERGPAGTAVGLLTGSLIGLLGGPVGLTIGAAVGGLTGLLFDLDRSGISVTFVDDVSKALIPGKAAVFADMDESWTTPVDTRLHKHGAVILRRLRSEVVEDQLSREAAAFQADLKRLDEELKQAGAENKAAIQKDIDAVKKQLNATQDQVRARLDDAKAEMDAKLKALQDQAKGANDRAKARIDKRIADVKADFAVRSKKLNQAWGLTKEALAA
ncbi:MAG: DUF1269 domain-containing protein [Parvularculaceae bacterium]